MNYLYQVHTFVYSHAVNSTDTLVDNRIKQDLSGLTYPRLGLYAASIIIINHRKYIICVISLMLHKFPKKIYVKYKFCSQARPQCVAYSCFQKRSSSLNLFVLHLLTQSHIFSLTVQPFFYYDLNSKIQLCFTGFRLNDLLANLYCNCVYLHWEGCVICSIYLR